MKLTTAAILFCLTSLPAYAVELVVKNGWVREAPPVSRVQAGYLELHNNMEWDMELVAIDSPDFARVELHETRLEKGVNSMHKLGNIIVPAGKSVTFEPDGKHLMLFNPAKPLRAGDITHFEFRFKNGHILATRLNVRKGTGTTDHSHHMHH